MAWPHLITLFSLLAPQDGVENTYFLEFAAGERRTNMEVEARLVLPNAQDWSSAFFPAPGESRLTATFVAPAAPRQAILEVEHLSSSAKVEFGGSSRIDVLVNGKPLVREWEVGTHVFLRDRLALTKMLRAGENVLELRFASGQTAYWLKRLEVQCVFPPDTVFSEAVERLDGGRDYAVVVSRRTFADAEWRKAVEALRERHHATVLVHDGPVALVRDALADLMPRHAAFVARPLEASRRYVIDVHRLARALDDDPYSDVFWGIVTGYDAGDALIVASDPGPLLVRRAAAGCGLDLTRFAEGRFYSETQQSVMFERAPGGEVEQKTCPADATEQLVSTLNEWRPDYFATSGHATPYDWQIGFSYRSGQFRCQDGRLFGLDLAGRVLPVDSPNPKVYGPAGNCLMGLVEDRSTMAPAWIHSAGVRQMIGFVVSTWYGYGAHGVNQIFIEQQGRFTFAEAFRANGIALVHRLATRFPRAAAVDIDEWGIEADPELLTNLAARHGIADRDALGLLWDRDTVAFYGDPAYEARVERVLEPAWSQTLDVDGDVFTFQVATVRDASWHRPPIAFLPRRVRDVEILEGEELGPVIADDFVLLPFDGAFAAGQTFRVAFRTRRR
ncbi:MAG: hypothetical protein HY812_11240 [Planctomycetes bacterium]|nr:hypothetical protein [Planctomycetota bacterium]